MSRRSDQLADELKRSERAATRPRALMDGSCVCTPQAGRREFHVGGQQSCAKVLGQHNVVQRVCDGEVASLRPRLGEQRAHLHAPQRRRSQRAQRRRHPGGGHRRVQLGATERSCHPGVEALRHPPLAVARHELMQASTSRRVQQQLDAGGGVEDQSGHRSARSPSAAQHLRTPGKSLALSALELGRCSTFHWRVSRSMMRTPKPPGVPPSHRKPPQRAGDLLRSAEGNQQRRSALT